MHACLAYYGPLSQCGHGHELTSVVRLADFKMADIRRAVIGSTGNKVLFHHNVVSEAPASLFTNTGFLNINNDIIIIIVMIIRLLQCRAVGFTRKYSLASCHTFFLDRYSWYSDGINIGRQTSFLSFLSRIQDNTDISPKHMATSAMLTNVAFHTSRQWEYMKLISSCHARSASSDMYRYHWRKSLHSRLLSPILHYTIPSLGELAKSGV